MTRASPAQTRAPKKSESLEVRLPHTTKAAFMARCKGDGLTASDAVRRFIEGEIDRAAAAEQIRPPARPFWWQAIAAGLAGLALGAVAAPSLAHPTVQAACAHAGR